MSDTSVNHSVPGSPVSEVSDLPPTSLRRVVDYPRPVVGGSSDDPVVGYQIWSVVPNLVSREVVGAAKVDFHIFFKQTFVFGEK